MSSLEYQQSYRSHKGQPSMAQHRVSQGLTLSADDYLLPMPTWRGFETNSDDGGWVAISGEYMTAVLDAAGADRDANMAMMKAGGTMKLGGRLYRWVGGE